MAETLTPYQRDILVKTILGEARGEGETGMAAVAHNILNRANSGQYSSDPAEVALQNKQYSTWNSGEGGNNPGQFQPGTKAYETAAQVLDRVVGGEIPDMTGGALQYHAKGVTPYWADEANTQGKLRVGNHVFYPTRPVPPGEIPSVASLLDTQRPAPNPAALSPIMAALRANTSPSGGDTGLQAALNAMATREARRVTPADAFDRTTARNKAPSSTNDAARRAVLSMGGNQTMAGQDRGQGLPMRPSLSPGAGQSYAGQDRVQTQFNGDPGIQALGSVVGQIPSVSSGIGQPPATRSVQSVPATSRTSRDNVSGQRAEQVAQQFAEPAAPIQLPNQAQLKAATGFSVPQGSQFQYSPTPAPERLSPQVMAINAATALPTYGAAAQSGGLSRDALAMRAAGAGAVSAPPIAIQPTLQAVAPPMPRTRPSVAQALAPSIQRPMIAAQPMIRNVAAALAQPPRVVVTAEPLNRSNHNDAQIAAIQEGRSYYTGSDGAVQPTRSIGGGIRNTYGD